MQTRSWFIDNAKGTLIFLVVWGHMIEVAARAGGISQSIYAAIYLFHMPAFAMVSGMLTRNTYPRETFEKYAFSSLSH